MHKTFSGSSLDELNETHNMEKTAEYKKRVEEYEAVGPVGAYEAGKQRRFDEMSTCLLLYKR